MMRTFFTGSLIVLVAGAGYWYWTQEPQEQSGKLTHTPKIDTSSKGKSTKRERWSKALAKASPKKAGKSEPVAKAAAKASAKAAKKAPAKKDSSNKAFAGLKASSLASDKKEAKPSLAKKSTTKAKKQMKAKPALAKKSASKPANKGSQLAARAPSSKGMESVSEGAVPGFSIPRIALSTGVEKREPVALSKRFANGSRVHLFMEARNLSDSEQTLVVHWHDPALADPVSVPLSVPAKASRYRTWANSSPLKRSGAHEVSVQFKDGPEIYRRSFEVLAVEVPATEKVDGRSSR